MTKHGSPLIIDGGDCCFCMGRGTADMARDKNGRPYTVCRACGTRAFLGSKIAADTFLWIMRRGVNFYAMSKQDAAQQTAPKGATA